MRISLSSRQQFNVHPRTTSSRRSSSLAAAHCRPQITLSNHNTFFGGGLMDSLFSTTLKAGDRTYFVDVKEARNKSRYLTISETRRSGARDGEKKFSRSSVMVFDDQVEKFRDALEQAVAVFKQ